MNLSDQISQELEVNALIDKMLKKEQTLLCYQESRCYTASST